MDFNTGDRVTYTSDVINDPDRTGSIAEVFPDMPALDGQTGYIIWWDGDGEPEDDVIYTSRRLSPGPRPDPITEAARVLIGAGRQDLAEAVAATQSALVRVEMLVERQDQHGNDEVQVDAVREAAAR